MRFINTVCVDFNEVTVLGKRGMQTKIKSENLLSVLIQFIKYVACYSHWLVSTSKCSLCESYTIVAVQRVLRKMIRNRIMGRRKLYTSDLFISCIWFPKIPYPNLVQWLLCNVKNHIVHMYVLTHTVSNLENKY